MREEAPLEALFVPVGIGERERGNTGGWWAVFEISG